MENWRTENLTKTYLEGVRGAIPYAKEQIDLIIRVIKFFRTEVNSFLDLGCGDGILGRNVFAYWPNSKGIFVDFSEPMIEAAKHKCGEYQNQASFVVQDFGSNRWIESISNYDIPVDLVVSGFSIHHQDNDNKKRIFNEIFHRILKPGGVFINLEQVASPTRDIGELFDEFFIDYMGKYQQESDSKTPLEEIVMAYYDDKKQNILATVEDQCKWLRKIGFINVDCYFKVFELSIFGGVKPK